MYTAQSLIRFIESAPAHYMYSIYPHSIIAEFGEMELGHQHIMGLPTNNGTVIKVIEENSKNRKSEKIFESAMGCIKDPSTRNLVSVIIGKIRLMRYELTQFHM